MPNRITLAAVVALFAGPALVAAGNCPVAVTKAALGAHPKAKVTACRAESEHGRAQYSVTLAVDASRSLELDVSPEGKVLLTEERLAVEALPKSVREAFAAKYPGAKASRAEKEVTAEGAVSYELAFSDARGKKHEATFHEDGSFVDEE